MNSIGKPGSVKHWIFILLILPVLIGCRNPGASYPVSPDPVDPGISFNKSGESSHQLWGFWDAYIPESHDTIEFVPRRGLQIHLNARRFLEYLPCDDCLKLVWLYIDNGNNKMTAEIQLTHPYPGIDKFTGFDVRAIVISDGSRYFPGLDARVPDSSLGDFTADIPGFLTRMWNTVEFPTGSGPFKILEYSQGKLASPGGFTGTVNPYVPCFIDSDRHIFPAGQSQNLTFLFHLPPGAIHFGYAIDASWEKPKVDPPVNILGDFPLSANALEPMIWGAIQVEWPTSGVISEGKLEIMLGDYQGWETVKEAKLECPDLWSGTVSTNTFQPGPMIGYMELVSTQLSFTNEFEAPSGDYKALLEISDNEQDYYLGNINRSYRLLDITVNDKVEPDLTGKMVFIAPSPPQEPFDPGTSNVFLYDFDTGTETQLTDFFGVGYLFHEPRINAQGTHHLHCNGPTPWYGNVRVYEFGGSNWTISTDEVDDYADFHPDGIHIITATGEMWGDTPDLYVMEYDGSNRTKIATATDTISNPKYSPDGNRVVMSVGITYQDPPSCQMWLYDIPSETWTEIMAANGIDINPSWSPVKVDGRELIVFESSRDNYPDYGTDIFVIDADTEEVLFKLDTGVDESHPSFSPDGLSFVFSMVDADGDTELYVCEWYTGGNVTQITSDDTYDGVPSWSWNW